MKKAMKMNRIASLACFALVALTVSAEEPQPWGWAYKGGTNVSSLTNRTSSGGAFLAEDDLVLDFDEIRFAKGEVLVDGIVVTNRTLSFVGHADGTTLKPDPQSVREYGGAIQTDGGSVVVTNLTFGGFYVESAGGALALCRLTGDSSVVGCSFLNCTAAPGWGDGGALFASAKLGTAVTLTVRDSAFAGCAALRGGAIANVVIDADDECAVRLAVSDCSFVDNEASSSGGALVTEGDVTVAETLFDGNVAGYDGGAVCAGSSDPDFAGCAVRCLPGVVFRGNKAIETTYRSGTGGAVSLASGKVGFIAEKTAFLANSADWGGGVFAYTNGMVSVLTSIFSNNLATAGCAGGAMSFQWSEVALTNLTVRGSNAGAVDFYKSSAEIVNCVVIDNDGGADLSGTGDDEAMDLVARRSAFGSVLVDASVALTTNECLVGRTAADFDGASLYLKGSPDYNPVAAEGIIQAATDFDGVDYGSRDYGYSMGAFECATESCISGESYTFLYDGKGHTNTFTSASVNIPVTWTYSTTGADPWTSEKPAFTNVGEYTTHAIAKLAGFSAITNTQTVTITNRYIDIVSASATKTYDSKPLMTNDVWVVGTGDYGLAEGDFLCFDCTGSQTNVGTNDNVFTYSVTNVLGEVMTGNYSVTATTGELVVVTAPMPPPDHDPDPEGPDYPPEAGPFDGPDFDDPKTPPTPTNKLDGTGWQKLSNYDVVTVYDGESHTFDTNNLVAKLENYKATAVSEGGFKPNDYTLAYSLTGVANSWTNEPFAFTDVTETPTSFWYRVSVPNFTNYIHAVGVTITQRVVTVEFPTAVKMYDGTVDYDGVLTTEVVRATHNMVKEEKFLAEAWGKFADPNTGTPAFQLTNVTFTAKEEHTKFSNYKIYFGVNGDVLFDPDDDPDAPGPHTFDEEDLKWPKPHDPTAPKPESPGLIIPQLPPPIDPDDPYAPQFPPEAGPYFDDPGEEPPEATTNGVLRALSNYDVVTVYDGLGHTFDYVALTNAIETNSWFYSGYKIEYSVNGTNWQDDPYVYTNVVSTSFWYKVTTPFAHPNYSNYIHAVGVTVTNRHVAIETGSRDFIYDGQPHAYTNLTVETASAEEIAAGKQTGFVPGEGVSGTSNWPWVREPEEWKTNTCDITIRYNASYGSTADNYHIDWSNGIIKVMGRYYVKYDKGAGNVSGTMDTETWYIGIPHDLATNRYERANDDPEGPTWKFAGWATNYVGVATTNDIVFGDGQKSLLDLAEPNGTCTLTAVWTHDYIVYGDIKGDYIDVKLWAVPVGAKDESEWIPVMTCGDAPNKTFVVMVGKTGEYDLVADFTRPNGDVTRKTTLVDVCEARTYAQVVLPDGDWNSVVDNTEAGSWPVIARGLDEIATNNIPSGAKSIEVRLIVTDKPDYGAMTPGEKRDHDIIVTAATTNDVDKLCNPERVVRTFDLMVVKSTTYTNEAGAVTSCTTNYPGRAGDEVIERPVRMLIPFELEGRTDFWCYRVHTNETGVLESVPLTRRDELLSDPDDPTDDCWALLNENGKHYFVVQSSKFSMFGIGYRGAKLQGDGTTSVPPLCWTKFPGDMKYYASLKLNNYDGWPNTISNLRITFPTRKLPDGTVYAQLLVKTGTGYGRYVPAQDGTVMLSNLFDSVGECRNETALWGLTDAERANPKQIADLGPFALYIYDAIKPADVTVDQLLSSVTYESYGWTNTLVFVANGVEQNVGGTVVLPGGGTTSEDGASSGVNTLRAGGSASNFPVLGVGSVLAAGETAPWSGAAQTYDGYLHDDTGVMGVFQMKVAKAKISRGVTSSTVTATVQLSGETKKLTFKGGKTDSTGVVTTMTSGGWTLTLELGKDGVAGTLVSGSSAYALEGVRNRFASKVAAEKGAAESILTACKPGAVAVWDDGDVTGKAPGTGWSTLSLTLAAKGKAKVSVVLANGTKISATGQLLAGTDCGVVPVVVTKKLSGSAYTFAALVCFDDTGVWIGGSNLADAAAAKIDSGWSAATALPEWEPIDIPAAVAEGFWRDAGELSWKPKYTAKSGLLTSTYKLMTQVKGKDKAQAVKFTGVVIDGVGYGTSVLSGKGSWRTIVR